MHYPLVSVVGQDFELNLLSGNCRQPMGNRALHSGEFNSKIDWHSCSTWNTSVECTRKCIDLFPSFFSYPF